MCTHVQVRYFIISVLFPKTEDAYLHTMTWRKTMWQVGKQAAMATDRVDNMQRLPGIAWHMHLVNLLVNDH
jgi:hypothetical protein